MPPALPRSFPRRASLAAALLSLVLVSAQQDKASLTDQFPKMSAKERARIAAKENEEAQKDGSYQEVMQRAERSFQEGRYEEAIQQYEEARAMRPYNVYPKVKIEDLRALIARQAPKQDTAHAPGERTIDPRPVVQPPTAASGTGRGVPEPVAQPVQPPPTVSAPPAPLAEKPPVAASATTPINAADGVIEQRYREGQAFVIERAVTVEGRSVKFKRVYHPSGQTFYFEDGLSVDERVWKARFPDR